MYIRVLGKGCFSLFFFLITNISLLGQTKFEIFTPDPEINREIEGIPVNKIDYLVYDETGDMLTIDPVLPPEWAWFAGKGNTSSGERLEFFFRNGHLYASSVEVCGFRNRTYPDIITDKIESNVFTIGFRKYDETLIFVANEEAIKVDLTIDASVFGEEKHFEFYLDDNESQLIRIFPEEEPYRP